MNKLVFSLGVVTVLGLFNAYSSAAENKKENNEQQDAQSKQHCALGIKEMCCKTEKVQADKCCACCTGPTCTAHGSKCCAG